MNTLTIEQVRNQRVARWLLICCALVFAMVVLGGFTRLTESGLSMVDWRPATGWLPPLSDAAWDQEFSRYQQSPQYLKSNSHMNVHDFKGIFWLEYLHRLLGRIIGLAFLLPFLYFAARGYIRRSETPKFTLMFVLGGLQGVLGWYMVKSGLVDNPAVSQYRLTAHLVAAFMIYGFMLWVALSRLYPAEGRSVHPLFGRTLALSVLILVTIISGGFVAGLRAGKIYNTFPMMGDYWIPPGLFALEPAWRNFFDNIATVQFDHRVLAITTFTMVCLYWWRMRRAELPRRIAIGVNALLHTAILQVVLGISTLLLMVPIVLGAAHQAVAMLLFTIALYLCHSLRRV
ncbi:COX15/CtaA family protein [Woeseia oceani]|nr:COX15/CtaA family protein [Woeseia oceani]